jgi:hypothetical protein
VLPLRQRFGTSQLSACVLAAALRWFENIMSVEQHATLALTLDPGGPSENEIRRELEAAAITIREINLRSRSGARTLTLTVTKPRRRSEAAIPAIVDELSRRSGVAGLEWRCLD